MKLIHLSDLHIGKRVNEQSMIEDQEHILEEILKIISEQKPNAVILAGDIYDKSVPSAEAVTLFNDFIVKLSKMLVPVFIISGNHDSAERLAFASELIERAGIYISPVYNGEIPYILDEFGGIKCMEANPAEGDAWGYGDAAKTKEDFYKRLEAQVRVLIEMSDKITLFYATSYVEYRGCGQINSPIIK